MEDIPTRRGIVVQDHFAQNAADRLNDFGYYVMGPNKREISVHRQ